MNHPVSSAEEKTLSMLPASGLHSRRNAERMLAVLELHPSMLPSGCGHRDMRAAACAVFIPALCSDGSNLLRDALSPLPPAARDTVERLVLSYYSDGPKSDDEAFLHDLCLHRLHSLHSLLEHEGEILEDMMDSGMLYSEAVAKLLDGYRKMKSGPVFLSFMSQYNPEAMLLLDSRIQAYCTEDLP